MAAKISRRRFVLLSGAAAGALAIGYVTLKDEEDTRLVFQKTARGGEVALNAWLKIDADGRVTVAAPRAEMGQGVYTALAMLVAEELDADWSRVGVEDAPVHSIYANRVMLQSTLPFEDGYHRGENTVGAKFMAWLAETLAVQGTGGSTTVRDAWTPLRRAGACAKMMLIEAAAQRWGVPAGECTASESVVHHAGSNRQLGYGELAAAASALAVPADPVMKNANDYKLLGTAVPRLDIAAKVTGRAEFGIDVRHEGMLYAAVRNVPVFGGTVERVDEASIKGMPGMVGVVTLKDGVAVVADSWWRAQKAVTALDIDFGDGGNAGLDNALVSQTLAEAIRDGSLFTYRDDGDVEEAAEGAGETINAVYQAPFLAHACMEPMNCTARIENGKVEVWMPNQAPILMQFLASNIADVDMDDVTIHTTFLGGGFGRRGEGDLLVQAVTVAKAYPGKVVKLLWSREEDIRHDVYRPAARSEFAATLDAQGRPLSWHNRIAGQVPTKSVMKRLFPIMAIDKADNTSSEGSADMPYRIANLRVEHSPIDLPVPVGFWRSVGHSYNAFFVESFMDELAHAARQDPYRYRRELLDGHGDFLAVLDRLATEAEWNTSAGPGRGKGIALHESFGSIVGQVAEITMLDATTVRLDRVVCVVDCGRVVNPDTVVAQMQSGIVFGLTAALYGDITLKGGAVRQANFPDYEMLHLSQMPEIEVHLAPSGRTIGGIGEVATPPIAPALTNAIFNATGKRLRELPITKAGYNISVGSRQ